MSQSPSPERLDALDSLRGLAAGTVVLHHCLITLPLLYATYFKDFITGYGLGEHPWPVKLAYHLSYSPIHLLWGGQEAVILFFVLSGFVLALPFVAGRQPAAAIFVLKRLIRLYPPYLAAVCLAFAMHALLNGPFLPETSAWFGSLWHSPLTWTEVTNHLLMQGQLNAFNSVVWSLVPEVHVSLIFPLLMWVMLRVPGPVSLGLSWYATTEHFRNWVWGWVGGFEHARMVVWWYLDSLRFLPYFAVGALLARYKGPACTGLDRLGTAGRIMLATLALFLLNVRWQMPFALPDANPVIGVGALLLVALCVQRPPAFLKHPTLVWLGQRSFSLYLVHEVVLLSLVNGLFGWVPLWLLLLVMPVVSVMVAHQFHRVVELPAIALGRRLAGCLTARSETPS
jgi:peptidoglycan/LPS O-acetylase OafA/YrhL